MIKAGAELYDELITFDNRHVYISRLEEDPLLKLI